MLQVCFQESFTSDFFMVKEKVKHILEFLKSEIPSLAEETLLDLRVIYNELIANAIMHGNKKDLTKKVELSIEIDDRMIISVMRDEGDGFDYSNIINSTEALQDTFYEHGRGLRLVLSLSDYVSWNELGNEIKFYMMF